VDLGSPLTLTAKGWEPVTSGDSGAVVLRSADGTRYAKFVTPEQQTLLKAERDRLDWASRHGIPTAQVLDLEASGDWVCLVTSTVPGVSADRLSASALWQAWPSITATMRQLHSLPAEDCPFVRGVTEMFADAEDVVGRGAVNPQFLPIEIRDQPAVDVLTNLDSERQQRLREEEVDLVVCHGDLCLPNVLIDPVTHRVSGFIDLGRLGRADRYADVALLLANSRGTWLDESQATAADDLFADLYGITFDHARMQFYLCLDALTWPNTT